MYYTKYHSREPRTAALDLQRARYGKLGKLMPCKLRAHLHTPRRWVMTGTPTHCRNYIITATFPIPASYPITALDLLSLHPSNHLCDRSHTQHRHRHYRSVERFASSSTFPQVSSNAKFSRMRYRDGSLLRCANNKGGL